ncbi:MAG TPA: TonB-dependent receptor [Pedobacter sp.]|jgi:outer membrane receptor protein involved in Fe transport
MKRSLILLSLFIMPFLAAAQIKGRVSEAETGNAISGASINIKNTSKGTISDSKGNFEIKGNFPANVVLTFSAIGYSIKEVQIANPSDAVSVALSAKVTAMDEVVVSASRVQESIMQSPVTVEKLDSKAIRNTTSFSFYEGLQSIKSLDMVTSSLTFRAVNTRGFGGIGTGRLLQLVDGVDNQTPGLNFSVGNLFGSSDLDMESVELIPGAASALYGPVAFNGVLMLRTKNPYQFQGLSVQGKLALNHLNDPNTSAAPVYDASLRYAKAFNNRFAFKVNASYLKGLDWYATNYTTDLNPGAVSGPTNPAKNLVNIYGDEVSNQQPIPNAGFVSRTGYEERDLSDYNVDNLKLNGALHYRITDNIEAIYQYNWGRGTANYTGSSRFAINNFTLQQHRLELKGANFFVRGYTTVENSHDSYNSRTLGQKINQTWVRDLNGNVVAPDKADETWFARYGGAFNGAVQGVTANSHSAARTFADQGRFLPGSAEFNREKVKFKSIRGITGAGIFSNSKLYHAEGQYDFSNLTKVVNLLVGGNFRMFDMNTEGTLFDDLNKEITIKEGGAFIQASKLLLDEKLKLTASARYDKNENFDGSFTPRASLVYSPVKNHNFRASIQTGFRNPTPVDQLIKLNAGVITILGGARKNSEGLNVYENAFTAASAGAFRGAVQGGANPQTAANQILKKANTPYVKPERIQSYEIGYKGLIAEKLFVDANYYYSSYKDFIANQVVFSTKSPVLNANGTVNMAAVQDLATPGNARLYQVYTNADDKVSSQGAALGLTYYLPKNYLLSGNGSLNTFDLKNANRNNVPAFNTPKYQTNLSIENRSLYKNIGFNVNWRWQTAFDYIGTFTGLFPGRVPAYSQLGAQVSYKVPSLKSSVKFGASNLTNKYNVQAFGSPAVGGLYYVSLTFDDLLK